MVGVHGEWDPERFLGAVLILALVTNMTKKKIIIISMIVLIMIVLVVVVIARRKKPVETIEPPIFYPAEEEYIDYDEYESYQTILPEVEEGEFLLDVEIPQEDTIEISGVVMPNFYKFGSKPGLIGETTIINNRDYQIIYYPYDEGFLIPILNRPFNDYRVLAEEDFVRALSISKQDACKLKLGITTPFSINPEEAGINWPLSWCE
jgi:hypothetical protein